MANISRNSYNEASLYDMVIQQQGMPYTDYDYNELQDIQRVKLRRIISELLGDGAVGTGLQVTATTPTPNMVVNIAGGTYYLNGYRAVNPTMQTITVAANSSGSSRTDIIYLRVHETEITSLQDPNIKHPSLSIEPTRRSKVLADVLYGQGTTVVPSNTATDFYVLLATITVANGASSITSVNIADNRVVKTVVGGASPTFSGTVTTNALVTQGGGTTHWANITFLPQGAFSTAQTNSIIHSPLYNSSGNTTAVAQIDMLRISTADGSYDGEISLKTRATGGALTEAGRFKKDGSVTFNGVTMASNSKIKGTGSGISNSSIIGFYESDGTTRKGFAGDGASSDNDIYLFADVGSVKLSVNTFGVGLSLSQAGVLTTGKGNILDDGVAGAATFQSNITASTAPAAGGHLTNKTYVDNKVQTCVDLTSNQTISGSKTFSTSSAFTSGLTVGPNLILKGSGVGIANITTVSFFESDGTTRKGYVGDAVNGNNDIYLFADTGNINLGTAGAGTGLSLSQSGVLSTSYGNILDNGSGAASFVGFITASTAPTAGGHLTNKTYVDAQIAIAKNYAP